MTRSRPSAATRAGGQRFPYMDGTRGVAVSVVIVGHWLVAVDRFHNSATWLVLQAGHAMVAFFFTLSAFLLYRPYVSARLRGRPARSVSSYLFHRAARIVPAYWFALTFLALWPGLAGVFSEDWWLYYGLLQSFTEEGIAGGLGPAWTLSVEVAFYLALPLLAMGLHRWGGTSIRADIVLCAVLAIVSIAFRAWAVSTGDRFRVFNIGSCAAYFAVGMALAAVHSRAQVRERPLPAARPAVLWAASGVVLLAALVAVNPEAPLSFRNPTTALSGTAYYVGMVFAAALLMLPGMLTPAARPDRLARRLQGPVLVWLGTLSYGLYLWHSPFLFELGQRDGLGFVPGRLEDLAVLAIGSAATVACAAASWYFVERPILERSSRRRPTEAASPTPPAAPISAPVS